MKASEFADIEYEERYRPKVSTGKILHLVADRTQIPSSLIMGRRRTPAVALARQVCYWLMRRAGHTYTHIGEVMGRDMQSVRHGCTVVRNSLLPRGRLSDTIRQMEIDLGITEAE